MSVAPLFGSALIVLSIIGGVAPEARAPADVAAWLYVPRPASSVERLRSSSFKPLVPILLQEDELKSLQTDASPLLLTWPANSPAIEPPQSWREGPADQPPVKPLAEDATFVAAGRAAPSADTRFHADATRYFAALPQQPGGMRRAQALRRLGLDSLTRIDGRSQLVDPTSMTTEASLTFNDERRGIMAALGPPVSPVWPASVPKNAMGFMALSVLPATFWSVLETVAAGARPIEYGLARVQLDTLEQNLGKRWAEDALGRTPKLWTVYGLLNKKGRVDIIAVLEVNDGQAAAALLSGMGQAIADVIGGAAAQSGTAQGSKTLTLRLGGDRALHMAFSPAALIVATSRAALDAHLAWRGKVTPLALDSTGPAVAFGAQDGGLMARWQLEMASTAEGRAQSVVAERLADALRTSRVGRGELLGNLGRTTWMAKPSDTGFDVAIYSRARSGAATRVP